MTPLKERFDEYIRDCTPKTEEPKAFWLLLVVIGVMVLFWAHTVITPDGKPLDMTGEETMREEGR